MNQPDFDRLKSSVREMVAMGLRNDAVNARTREIVSMLEEGLSILTSSGAMHGMGEAGFRCAIDSIKDEYPDAFAAPDGGE